MTKDQHGKMTPVYFFSACDNDKEDTGIPQIVIESPEEGATFDLGDTVHIKVDITHIQQNCMSIWLR
ncbi:MAG: hypothetical protein SH848_15180 [Saprospiraceae bacterium]|nr:hypothetical protein [Saprospiraceae bacterium]MDZ4705266.1 hypothetical protein [Saprospiraceae bacterium]